MDGDRVPRPLDETLEVSTPAQLKALGHPLRQRLLFALGEPATMSQLAAALSAQKGNVAHHLKVLREAGMVRVVGTRQVRGGTEHCYQRTTQRVHVGGSPAESTAALLQAVADEIAPTADEPLLVLRHLRLTAAQARDLGAALSDLVDTATDAGADEPRYGVLIGMYQTE
jgi:DNA-binding transcriptional ArsR family regulator